MSAQAVWAPRDGTTLTVGSNRATTFPQLAQLAKLTANDGAANDYFGYVVALSGDGNTVIVGAGRADLTSPARLDQGAVYVYTWSGGTWTQQSKLVAADGAAGDYFGSAVALSSDGNTALVGAYHSSHGAAYVFVRSGTTWTQQQKLTDTGGAAGDEFGVSVALSGDGKTALVGAEGRNDAQGVAYVFIRSGESWTAQDTLDDSSGESFDYFGCSVALNSDGNTALIGAQSGETTTDGSGAAYVFTRSSGTWTQQAKFAPAGIAGSDHFGDSVALSGDGKTALIGAPLHNSFTKTCQGAAYLYGWSGTAWTELTGIIGDDSSSYDNFGTSVALSADASTALIGAPNASRSGVNARGFAYVFARAGTTWSQQAKLAPNPATAYDHFGQSVALSAGGGMALVGSPQNDNTPLRNGAGYMFGRSGISWAQQAEQVAADGGTDDGFGVSIAQSQGGGTYLIGTWDEIGHNGAIYVYMPSGSAQRQSGRSASAWTQQAKITSPGAVDDRFGTSVAISGDGKTLLVGAWNTTVGGHAAQGVAYAYAWNGTAWMLQGTLSDIAGAASDHFGAAVALSADGNVALVGAYGVTVAESTFRGAALMFRRSAGAWTQRSRLTADDGAAGDEFGISVALSGDAGTALLGANGARISGKSSRGAAYVFAGTEDSWSQQAKLASTTGAANDKFGSSVSLAGDGNMALVGAPQAYPWDSLSAAYVFAKTGTTWAQQAKLVSSDLGGDDYFGSAVALSADGLGALVGSWNNGSGKGAGYLFGRNGTNWTQQAKLTASDGVANDHFGTAVSLSSDGLSPLLARKPGAVNGHSRRGAVYVFGVGTPAADYPLFLPFVSR